MKHTLKLLPVQSISATPMEYIMVTKSGKVTKQGAGISFFYRPAVSTVIRIPLEYQSIPFLLNLHTADFQSLRVQGLLMYHISDPQALASKMDFSLEKQNDALNTLQQWITLAVQTQLTAVVQETPLREALKKNSQWREWLTEVLSGLSSLTSIGISVDDVNIENITPTPETANALEAEAREAILQEADDALYQRRKYAVEQERVIAEAEIQTEVSLENKRQEKQMQELDNRQQRQQREVEIQHQSLLAETELEVKRSEMVKTKVANDAIQASASTAALAERMRALAELPGESLKALAVSQMPLDSVLADAITTLVNNAEKIDGVHFGNGMLEELVNKARQKK